MKNIDKYVAKRRERLIQCIHTFNLNGMKEHIYRPTSLDMDMADAALEVYRQHLINNFPNDLPEKYS